MRAWAALSLVSLSACFDFTSDLAACQASGVCVMPVDASVGVDGGTSDAGTADGGAPDAGGQCTALMHGRTNSEGWAWEYPLPVGGSLRSVVAVSSTEAYAWGQDALLFHWANGTSTYSLVPHSDEATRAGRCLVAFEDGGLLGVDSRAELFDLRLGSVVQGPSMTVRACAASKGALWLGGSGCPSNGNASVIFEGATPRYCGQENEDILAFDPAGYALTSYGAILARDDGGSWSTLTSVDAGVLSGGALRKINDDFWVEYQASGAAMSVVALYAADGGGLVGRTTTPGAPVSMLTGDPGTVYLGESTGVTRCQSPLSCNEQLVPPASVSTDSFTSWSYADHTLFGVGLNGQVLRWAQNEWQVLAPGGFVMQDFLFGRDCTMWAGGVNGTVIHRTADTWAVEHVPSTTSTIYRLTQLDDGTMIFAGWTLFAQRSPSGAFSNIKIAPRDGGVPYDVFSASVVVRAVSGHRSGHVWAVADNHGVIQRGLDGGWAEVGPEGLGQLNDLVTNEDGTAWAVGEGTVLFYDGTRWARVPSPLIQPGGIFLAVTSVDGRQAIAVSTGARGQLDSIRIQPDGGGESFVFRSEPYPATSVTSRALSDGGLEAWALSGVNIYRREVGSDAVGLLKLATPSEYPQRIVFNGNRLWAVGSRGDGQAEAFILSIDAGLR